MCEHEVSVCCIPRISFTMKAVAMGNLCLSQKFPSPSEKLPNSHTHSNTLTKALTT